MKIAIFISILLTLALVTPTTIRADTDKQALTALLEDFLRGASVNDAEMHDRFWAEELIYTSSNGTRFGKAEIMAGLAEGDDAADSGEAPRYSAEAVTIQVFDDTAVITFELVAEQGDGQTERYFNSGVFRRAEIGWQAVVWQATRQADPTKPEPFSSG